MARGIEVHNGKVIMPSGSVVNGKKIYWATKSVTGSMDLDLTTEFSAIDYVFGMLAADPDANASFAEVKKGAVTGHVDIKVWKPAALETHTHANTIAGGALTGADLAATQADHATAARHTLTNVAASGGTPSFEASTVAKDVNILVVGDPA